MKSKIKFPWFTPRRVKDVYKEVVHEWDDLHKDSPVFTVFTILRTDYGDYFIVGKEGECFSLSVNKKGIFQRIECKGNNGLSITSYINLYIVCTADGRRFSCGSFKELNTTLGVDDVTNLQPHEKGILRLKYNIDAGAIFIPKVVIRQWTTYREIKYLNDKTVTKKVDKYVLT